MRLFQSFKQMSPLCQRPDSKCKCQAVRSKLSQTWASSNIYLCTFATAESQIYHLWYKSVSCFGFSHIHRRSAGPPSSRLLLCTGSLLHGNPWSSRITQQWAQTHSPISFFPIYIVAFQRHKDTHTTSFTTGATHWTNILLERSMAACIMEIL